MSEATPPNLPDLFPRTKLILVAAQRHARHLRWLGYPEQLREANEIDAAVAPARHVAAIADAIRPLFRHGGPSGATGILYGWNPGAGGYGIWDNARADWFPDQTFVADIRDIDGPRFFAERALRALGLLEGTRDPATHSPAEKVQPCDSPTPSPAPRSPTTPSTDRGFMPGSLTEAPGTTGRTRSSTPPATDDSC